MDFTGCHMETLFLALLGTLGGPAMGPHMATQAIWVHMLQIGVQKGVSLLDLHVPPGGIKWISPGVIWRPSF